MTNISLKTEPRKYKSLYYSISVVTLNILGISVGSIIVTFRKYAMHNVIAGWVLSAFMSWICCATLTYLSQKHNLNGIHEVISKEFGDNRISRIIRDSIFYTYFLQMLVGQGLFASISSNAMVQLFHAVIPFPINTDVLGVMSYILLFGLILYMQTNLKKFQYSIHIYMSIIKVIIISIIPIVSFFFHIKSIASNFSFTNIITSVQTFFVNIPNLLNPEVISTAFDGTWILSGAESLVMDPAIRPNTATIAVPIGLALCAMLYILNTIACFKFTDLERCAKESIIPHSLLIPVNPELSTIILNIAIMLTSFGSFYGWFEVINATTEDNQYLMPKCVRQQSIQNQFIIMLISSFVITIVMHVFRNHHKFTDTLFCFLNMVLILVYAFGLIAFFWSKCKHHILRNKVDKPI